MDVKWGQQDKAGPRKHELDLHKVRLILDLDGVDTP